MLLTTDVVKIVDDGMTYAVQGEITVSSEQYLFMQAYKLKPKLEDVIIKDGDHDRPVAVVPVDSNFYSLTTPVAMYKQKTRLEPVEIDLHGYQSPTLEWFRGFKTRI